MVKMRRLSTTPLPTRWNPPEHDQPVRQHATANDKYIVAALTDSTVHVLCSRTGASLQKKPFVHPISWIQKPILDGDQLIMACSRDAALTVYDIPSEFVVFCFLWSPHSTPGPLADTSTVPRTVLSSTMSCPDGQYVLELCLLRRSDAECIVAAFHMDGSWCIWDVRSQGHLRAMRGVHDAIAPFHTVAGSRLATSGDDGKLAVSDWTTGEVLWTKTLGKPYQGPSRGCAAFAHAMWHGSLAVGTTDGMIRLYSLDTGHERAGWRVTREQDAMTQHLAPRGKDLVQASWGRVNIWSAGHHGLLGGVKMFDRAGTSLLVLDDGTILCCGRDATDDKDRCGLDEGIKGWKVDLDGSGKMHGAPEAEGDVFRVASPVRAARALMALQGGRFAFVVLKGAVWSVEIFCVS